MHDRDPADQREFATISVTWWIENNLPATRMRDFPHSLHRDIDKARTNRSGNTPTTPSHDDDSAGFYLVEVEAQRVSVPYRSPFEHHKPDMHLETAIVVGPQGEEVYTDELNRIRVQFVWDRLNPGNENASCWVRVVQSDTGGGYGGVHVPRIGEEVLIDYVGGDCDRPLAVGRVQRREPAAMAYRRDPVRVSVEGVFGRRLQPARDGRRDRAEPRAADEQQREQPAAPGLHHRPERQFARVVSRQRVRPALGCVWRGAGEPGPVRDDAPKAANSQPLDVKEAQQQFVTGESLVEAMSGVSEQHQAESLKDAQDTMRAFTDATQDSASGSASGGRTAGGGTGNANAFKSR